MRFVFIVLFSFTVLFAFSQKPGKTPIDTIKFNSIPIIMYTDFSWDYLHPADADEYFNVQNALFFDTVCYFNEFWKTDLVYVYEDTTEFDDSIYVPLFDQYHPSFILPNKGKFISEFGPRGSRIHYGVDIDCEVGDTILAAFDGKVRYAEYNKGGYGNFVVIRHFNGLETCYGHLDKIYVDADQYVKAGSIIGTGGNTGRSRGPHLHFETRYRGFAFDPERLIDYEAGTLKNDTILLTSRNFSYKSKQKYYPPVATSGKGTWYKVRSGDTLSAIAGRYGTTVNALCSLNGLTRNSILQIGQNLRVR